MYAVNQLVSEHIQEDAVLVVGGHAKGLFLWDGKRHTKTTLADFRRMGMTSFHLREYQAATPTLSLSKAEFNAEVKRIVAETERTLAQFNQTWRFHL